MIKLSKQEAAWLAAFGLALAVGGNPAVAADKRGTTRGANNDAVVLGNAILDRWQPIAEQAGRGSAAWREMFATQFSLMEPSTLRGIAALAPDELDADASYGRFSEAVRGAQMQTYAVAASGKGQAKLGSPTTDQVFIPIVPCRIVDTRNTGSPLQAGSTRNFWYFTMDGSFSWATQGGFGGQASSSCPGTVNPNGGSASAAVVTVTVVSPTEAGNFVIWGGSNPIPNTSALNWTEAGQALANTTVIPWGARTGSGPGGTVQDFAVAYNGPSGSAHFVADVVGYMVMNRATQLDCVQPNNEVVLPVGGVQTFQTCPIGWTLTGGGHYANEGPGGAVNLWVYQSYPIGPSWVVTWSNQTGGTRNGRTYAVCCRVPGR